jgi:hypothetical protein
MLRKFGRNIRPSDTLNRHSSGCSDTGLQGRASYSFLYYSQLLILKEDVVAEVHLCCNDFTVYIIRQMANHTR